MGKKYVLNTGCGPYWLNGKLYNGNDQLIEHEKAYLTVVLKDEYGYTNEIRRKQLERYSNKYKKERLNNGG